MSFFTPPLADLPPASKNPSAVHSSAAFRYDVQWNRPVFRAPALTLPTQAQIWSEVPFTAQFRAKDIRGK